MRLVLTVYPWAHQISDTEWVPGRYAFMAKDARPSDKSLTTIRELSAAKGIELLDLTPAFRAYTGTEALHFQHDMHFTEAGQRVMAKGLEDSLGEGLVDQLCARP